MEYGRHVDDRPSREAVGNLAGAIVDFFIYLDASERGWLLRNDARMPFQEWRPFPPEAIVQVKNAWGDSRIGPASSFWWGYEQEMGAIGEGVIYAARRLDRPRVK